MKASILITGLLLSLVLVVGGCEREQRINTSKLESSFDSAETTVKTEVNQAIDAIQAGEYSKALASLRNVAKEAKLTPEQQAAIKDVSAQIQARVKETIREGAAEAEKALEGLQKSLNK